MLANSARAVDALGNSSADANEALLISACRATQYKQRSRSRSTYDELASTGTIGLIRSRTLRNCGDRFVEVGDYKGLLDVLDYPCRTDLPVASIDKAAVALRTDGNLAPLRRLRIADIESRLVDLTGNSRDISQGLQAVATDKP